MLNKAILMGRMTKDVEMRSTASGTSVASFTIAVDRRFTNQSGERDTDFINCVAWKKTAEHIAKYFPKGRMIAVCGSIQTRTWDDQQGKKHYVTEVLVDEVSFTGEKAEQKQDNTTQDFSNLQGFAPFDDGSEDSCPF